LKATEDLNLEGIVMTETMGVAIGIGLLLTAIIIGITDSALSFIAFALGFGVGLALLIYAGAKYNR
jgi:formate/nitrite transporter FocA (FNT family)